jgi:hypothetical protein
MEGRGGAWTRNGKGVFVYLLENFMGELFLMYFLFIVLNFGAHQKSGK